MIQFGKKVVKYRIPILIVSILLLVPSVLGYVNTRVNYDVLTYLPEEIETMKGQDIMVEDFGTGAFSMFIVDNMEDKDTVNIPLIFQLLILEIAIDGLRLAALNTPSMLSTPLSVIAGLVMGEFSVQSGWFNAEVMLYMAFVSVANYTQPNFELGYALKFMRLELLILTALFNWWGFVIGTLVIIGSICFNKTLSGRNYLNVKLN